MTTKTYYQCRFIKETPEGLELKIGWIENRGAKVGARVELKGEEGLWIVTDVTNPGITEREYEKVVSKSRTKFASIKEVVHG